MSGIENKSYLLAENRLLKLYQYNSSIALNNFLRGFVEKFTKFYNISHAVFHEKEIEILHRPPFENEDSTYGEKPYNPVTIEYISELIELDKVLEASRQWNTNPLTVYRGCSENELACGGNNSLISTSKRDDIAITFCDENTGVILKIELPENSPYIMPTQCAYKYDGFNYEKEVLLPPCDYEIVGEWKPKKENFINTLLKIFNEDADNEIKLITVKVKPKNLAKTFLERMNDLPIDYPNEFLEGKFGEEFKKSKAMLEEYVKSLKSGELENGSQPQPE